MDSGPDTVEDTGAGTWELRRLGFAEPLVQGLVADLQQEFTRLYGNPDETPLDPAMFDPPSGAFFVAFAGGEPVAMGGWRSRADVAAREEYAEQFPDRPVVTEIKRMYVRPARRGNGHARAVLHRLEESARDAGVGLMVLESGARQPEALTLYASEGYTPVPGYGFYRHSPTVRYLGKRL